MREGLGSVGGAEGARQKGEQRRLINVARGDTEYREELSFGVLVFVD
jgi:hypothetical protein